MSCTVPLKSTIRIHWKLEPKAQLFKRDNPFYIFISQLSYFFHCFYAQPTNRQKEACVRQWGKDLQSSPVHLLLLLLLGGPPSPTTPLRFDQTQAGPPENRKQEEETGANFTSGATALPTPTSFFHRSLPPGEAPLDVPVAVPHPPGYQLPRAPQCNGPLAADDRRRRETITEITERIRRGQTRNPKPLSNARFSLTGLYT